MQRLLSDGLLINLRPKQSEVEIIKIIRDMVATTRDLYGQDVFSVGTHSLQILITGGGGDFSIFLNVNIFDH